MLDRIKATLKQSQVVLFVEWQENNLSKYVKIEGKKTPTRNLEFFHNRISLILVAGIVDTI